MPRGGKRRFTDAQEEEIAGGYRSGKSLTELAAEVGASDTGILKILRRRGVRMRPRPTLADLTGRRFGRWKVISRAPNLRHHTRWLCRCRCGNVRPVAACKLTAKNHEASLSCGCLTAEKTRERFTKHGYSRTGAKTNEYAIWCSINSRCHCKTQPAYPRYGGRGIVVCERWRGEDGFVNFLNDMGPRPSKTHSVERIDNDGPYSPGNCRWATWTEQNRNRKSNHRITWKGQTRTIAEWSEITGIGRPAIGYRIKAGWSAEDTLTRPVRYGKSASRAQVVARMRVGTAVKQGRLPKVTTLTCCHCGRPATEYHHYKGYEKEHWLTVEPVCKACHEIDHHRPGSSHVHITAPVPLDDGLDGIQSHRLFR